MVSNVSCISVAFCCKRDINNFRIKSCYAKCLGEMPLSQFVAIFLLEEVVFLLYTLLVLRSSQFCFEFFLKKCDQVQKVGPAMAGSAGPDGHPELVNNNFNDEKESLILSKKCK